MIGVGLRHYAPQDGGQTLHLDLRNGGLSGEFSLVRTSTGTVFDSAGVLQVVGSGQPRFDHDPVSGEPLGLLIEGASTNLLLNSASLSTQAVTTAAGVYTLSFYGSGSVTLSGSFSGTLTGSQDGGRVSLTFTSSSGSLTLTVAGDVRMAQLEQFNVATSYIPTTGAAATRDVEYALSSGAGLTSWFSNGPGTVVMDVQVRGYRTGLNDPIIRFNGANPATDRITVFLASAGPNIRCEVRTANLTEFLQNAVFGGSVYDDVRVAMTWDTDIGYTASNTFNNNIVDPIVNLPTVTSLLIGGGNNSFHLKSLTYWPKAMTKEEVINISAR